MSGRARRVLLFSPFFYPEPIATGRYNAALARALTERGCEVRVICSHPLHPDWRPTTVDANLRDVDCKRGGAWVRYPRSQFGRRFFLEIWYAFHATKWSWRLRHDVDLALAVFPPMLFSLVVVPILKRGSVPVVGIVHDLQSVYLQRRRFTGRLLGGAASALEGHALSVCNHLYFLSRQMQEWARRRWRLTADRCDIAYPFVTVDSADGVDERLSELLPDNFLHVVYSGALGEKHEPDRVMAFFERLAAERSDIRCHIFSRGAEFDRIKQKSLVDVGIRTKLHDLVPAQELPALYARSTVHVIPQASGTEQASLPSKLPNILASGVPAFVICDDGSEAGELAVASGIGCAVHDWSVDGLCERMLRFIDDQAGTTHAERRKRVALFVDQNFSLDRFVDRICGAADGYRS